MKVKDQFFTEPEHDLELIQVTNMPLPDNIDQMGSSPFFKAADLNTPVLVTIRDIVQQNVAADDKPVDEQWVISFFETDKALVCKSVNRELMAVALQSRNPNTWLNQKIVLFNDPTVMFGGKATGGVRVRAPKNQPQQAMTEIQTDPELDDDIPF